jgi:hypothetical protein
VRRLLRTLRVGARDGGAESKIRDWRPATYRVVATDAGANINYDCYCGCDAGFAFDRADSDPRAESCCCGNRILVGTDASARLADQLDRPADYRIESRAVGMPWDEELDVALAIPRTS